MYREQNLRGGGNARGGWEARNRLVRARNAAGTKRVIGEGGKVQPSSMPVEVPGAEPENRHEKQGGDVGR
jgi:hypothetical protein